MRRHIAFALLLAASLAACGTPSEAPPRQALSADEIQTVLIGNTLVRLMGGAFFSWEYNGVHAADGTMVGRVRGPSEVERVSGTWEVTGDDLYCRTWSNNWGDGRRGCFRVSRAGEELIFEHVSGSSGGQRRYVYQWQAGVSEDF